MPSLDNSTKAFLALVRAGLWEKEARLLPFGEVDYEEVMRLAEEQTVVGLVTAGIEHIQDIKVPQEILLQFVGQSLQIEQRNKAMNSFLADKIKKMREYGIYILLVKGQGVAQCYERPLWRVSGDIDFLCSTDYRKIIEFLVPLSSKINSEGRYSSHQSMSIDSVHVEVHGSLRTCLSGFLDKEIDAVQRDVFYGGNVRSWMNEGTITFLPAPENDVFFVFTHFIKHFYKEGMNLRQICDWCRLLWTFRDKVDVQLLESRIKRAGVTSEWKSFASLAVDYLGMPKEAVPMYNPGKKWKKKGGKILNLIMKGYSGKRFIDTLTIARIFPLKTLRYSPGIFLNVNWLKIKERLFGDGNR